MTPRTGRDSSRTYPGVQPIDSPVAPEGYGPILRSMKESQRLSTAKLDAEAWTRTAYVEWMARRIAQAGG